MIYGMVGGVPSPETIWPVSVAGWVSLLVVVLGVAAWVARWGRDRDRWDRAASALEKLSKDVSELLFEIRGVNGKGGINDRLTEIEADVAHIKERNRDADVLVEMYKLELKQRAEEGKPFRRQMDQFLSTPTQQNEG